MKAKGVFNRIKDALGFRFSKLEESILRALLYCVSVHVRNSLNSQLARINLIKRDPDGYESVFYWVKCGRSRRDFPEVLDSPPGEFKAAEMRVFYYGREVPVIVWFFDGIIFRIEYGRGIETIEPRDNYEVEVTYLALELK